MRRATVAVLVLAWAGGASAWESQCRAGDGYTGYSGYQDHLGESVCVLPEEPGMSECAPGLQAARGAQLGEHTWITRQAMLMAGLPAAYVDPGDGPPTLDYYTLTANAPYAPGWQTTEPTVAGLWTEYAGRYTAIAEFAQLPDISWSVSDFILGHEHCPAMVDLRGSRDAIDACHTFTPHMGGLNSTHFLPQAREVYGLYHGIALKVADRCRAMAAAFAAGAHPLSAQAEAYVRACRTEALAFQAFAAHYAEDAWSIGHMWQRWGSPDFEDFRRDEEDRDAATAHTRALLVSMIGGLIHGARSVVRADAFRRFLYDQHDQMCLPGPWREDAAPPEYEAIVPRWRYPGGPDAPHWGGGDLYLRPCTARNQDSRYAVETGAELQLQYRRMLSCTARGFVEVYERAGAIDRGDAGALAGLVDPEIRDAAAGSLDDRCWNQRATNESLWVGFGLSGPAVVYQLQPDDAARFRVDNTLFLENVAAMRYLLYDPKLEAQLRDQLSVIAFEYERRSRRRLNDPGAPTKTTLADDPSPSLPGLLDMKPNGAPAYLAKIREGRVPYFERPDPGAWSAAGSPCPASLGCADDTQCLDASGTNSGQYFGWARAASGEQTQVCLEKEAAVLRAFRGAETPYWCTADTADDVAAATRTCQATGDSSSAACRACVELLLPHVRNGCDDRSYESPHDGVDHGSLCDRLGGDASVVHVPYDAAIPDTVRVAAGAYCVAGRQPLGSTIDYAFDAGPPAAAVDVDAAAVNVARSTCGAAAGTHWWRLQHPAALDAHTHVLTLRTEPLTASDGTRHGAPADALELTLYRGPDCTETLYSGLASDRDHDGVMDTLELRWEVPAGAALEACVRVKTLTPTAWTGYRFAVTRDGGSTCSQPTTCTPACGAGQTCCRRADCAHLAECPGECVDTTTDPKNCGCCGARCEYGVHDPYHPGQCCGGKCAKALTMVNGPPGKPWSMLDQWCCYNKPDEICSFEQVGYSTIYPQLQEEYCLVGGVPTRTNIHGTDPANCGGCGTQCQVGYACCSGICVDLKVGVGNGTSGFFHCGACGKHCDGPLATCCDGACISPGESAQHCGGCNQPCTTPYRCVIGYGCTYETYPDPTPPDCTPQGLLTCGYACYSPLEPATCGSCGTDCRPDGTCCNGQCYYWSLDPSNCGYCGTACAANQICFFGGCMDPTQSNMDSGCGPLGEKCLIPDHCCWDTGCVNLKYDDRHCNACGNACAPGTHCCSGGCVDQQTDAQNCGGCLKACGTGQKCCGGACYDAAGAPC